MLQEHVVTSLSCDSWPQEELRNCVPPGTVASGSSTTLSVETPTVTHGIIPGVNITFDPDQIVNSAPVLMGKSVLLEICLLLAIVVVGIFR